MTDHTIDNDPGTERIDIRERYETQLWMQALDVDERTLRKAVSEAGTGVDNVRKYLLERLKIAKQQLTFKPVAKLPVKAKVSARAARRPAKRARPAARTAVRAGARRKSSR